MTSEWSLERRQAVHLPTHEKRTGWMQAVQNIHSRAAGLRAHGTSRPCQLGERGPRHLPPVRPTLVRWGTPEGARPPPLQVAGARCPAREGATARVQQRYNKVARRPAQRDTQHHRYASWSLQRRLALPLCPWFPQSSQFRQFRNLHCAEISSANGKPRPCVCASPSLDRSFCAPSSCEKYH